MESYVTRIGDVTIERVLPKEKQEEVKGPPPEDDTDDEEEEDSQRDDRTGDDLLADDEEDLDLEEEKAEEEDGGGAGPDSEGEPPHEGEEFAFPDKEEQPREDEESFPAPVSEQKEEDNEDNHEEEDEDIVESEVAPVSVMESEDLLRDIKQEPPEEEPEPREGEEEQEEPLEEEEEDGEEGGGPENVAIKEEPIDEDQEDSLKRKSGDSDEDSLENMSKKKKLGEEGEGESSDKGGPERKPCNLRKNIREVMDETQLDEATLSAQRQEMERLRRVQDQQKYIREVQRQMAINRQNNKTQTRVISLLQGNTNSMKSVPGSSKPNTVLVKLSSNGGPPQVVNKKVLDVLKSGKSSGPMADIKSGICRIPNKPHMVTPSVSIAPVKPSTPVEPPKPKDVVTISSSSDEDDCIVISEPSDEEIEEEEDPNNSGMHTNDLYNIPDEQGRVLINVGKPENDPDVFLAPQIARIIKPHQIGGVRFMFDNVVESLERFKTSPGFGCILAHSMGLGKTLQVVSFCDVFLRETQGRTVMCIMPINTLQNWMAEFNMWLPTDPSSSPLSLNGEVRPRHFGIYVLNDLHKTIAARAKVVQDWKRDGGVLLIGYEMYRQLSLKRPARSRKGKRKIPEEDMDDEKNKPLLDEMHEALVKPGPDLVICDEGHRIKNSHASISHALKQIRTRRRIVLTGYPLQNNLQEYWCMVDFVRPNYLGTKTEFSNMFERPIQNGQCIDSTPQDIRLMRYRAHVLHSLLEGFVQRRSHAVLRNTLPQKEEYVLLVRMTPFQRTLYDTFMNEVVRTKAVPNPLKAFAVCCKIWNHPDILYNFLKKREMDELQDLDLEETAALAAAGNPVEAVNIGKKGKDRKGKASGKKAQAVATAIKTPAVATVQPNTSQAMDVKQEQPVQDSQGQFNQNFNQNYPYQQYNNSHFNQNYNNQNPEFSGAYGQNYNGNYYNQYPGYYPENYNWNQQQYNYGNYYPGYNSEGGGYFNQENNEFGRTVKTEGGEFSGDYNRQVKTEGGEFRGDFNRPPAAAGIKKEGGNYDRKFPERQQNWGQNPQGSFRSPGSFPQDGKVPSSGEQGKPDATQQNRQKEGFPQMPENYPDRSNIQGGSPPRGQPGRSPERQDFRHQADQRQNDFGNVYPQQKGNFPHGQNDFPGGQNFSRKSGETPDRVPESPHGAKDNRKSPAQYRDTPGQHQEPGQMFGCDPPGENRNQFSHGYSGGQVTYNYRPEKQTAHQPYDFGKFGGPPEMAGNRQESEARGPQGHYFHDQKSKQGPPGAHREFQEMERFKNNPESQDNQFGSQNAGHKQFANQKGSSSYPGQPGGSGQFEANLNNEGQSSEKANNPNFIPYSDNRMQTEISNNMFGNQSHQFGSAQFGKPGGMNTQQNVPPNQFGPHSDLANKDNQGNQFGGQQSLGEGQFGHQQGGHIGKDGPPPARSQGDYNPNEIPFGNDKFNNRQIPGQNMPPPEPNVRAGYQYNQNIPGNQLGPSTSSHSTGTSTPSFGNQNTQQGQPNKLGQQIMDTKSMQGGYYAGQQSGGHQNVAPPPAQNLPTPNFNPSMFPMNQHNPSGHFGNQSAQSNFQGMSGSLGVNNQGNNPSTEGNNQPLGNKFSVPGNQERCQQGRFAAENKSQMQQTNSSEFPNQSQYGGSSGRFGSQNIPASSQNMVGSGNQFSTTHPTSANQQNNMQGTNFEGQNLPGSQQKGGQFSHNSHQMQNQAGNQFGTHHHQGQFGMPSNQFGNQNAQQSGHPNSQFGQYSKQNQQQHTATTQQQSQTNPQHTQANQQNLPNPHNQISQHSQTNQQHPQSNQHSQQNQQMIQNMHTPQQSSHSQRNQHVPNQFTPQQGQHSQQNQQMLQNQYSQQNQQMVSNQLSSQQNQQMIQNQHAPQQSHVQHGQQIFQSQVSPQQTQHSQLGQQILQTQHSPQQSHRSQQNQQMLPNQHGSQPNQSGAPQNQHPQPNPFTSQNQGVTHNPHMPQNPHNQHGPHSQTNQVPQPNQQIPQNQPMLQNQHGPQHSQQSQHVAHNQQIHQSQHSPQQNPFTAQNQGIPHNPHLPQNQPGQHPQPNQLNQQLPQNQHIPSQNQHNQQGLSNQHSPHNQQMLQNQLSPQQTQHPSHNHQMLQNSPPQNQHSQHNQQSPQQNQQMLHSQLVQPNQHHQQNQQVLQTHHGQFAPVQQHNPLIPQNHHNQSQSNQPILQNQHAPQQPQFTPQNPQHAQLGSQTNQPQVMQTNQHFQQNPHSAPNQFGGQNQQNFQYPGQTSPGASMPPQGQHIPSGNFPHNPQHREGKLPSASQQASMQYNYGNQTNPQPGTHVPSNAGNQLNLPGNRNAAMGQNIGGQFGCQTEISSGGNSSVNQYSPPQAGRNQMPQGNQYGNSNFQPNQFNSQNTASNPFEDQNMVGNKFGNNTPFNQFGMPNTAQQMGQQPYPFQGSNEFGSNPMMDEQKSFMKRDPPPGTSCQTDPIIPDLSGFNKDPCKKFEADGKPKDHTDKPDNEEDASKMFDKNDKSSDITTDDAKKENENKEDAKKPEAPIKNVKDDPGIPYDWAVELLKGYIPGKIEASAKMSVFFCILEESIALGDRILVFSQSLFTLNLMEELLQQQQVPGKEEKWIRNINYYRLDGSTSALEREKLINEFNSNPNLHLFLVSTRAGSLGINLVGANRVIVFDASWNPCHDTQAVCRVYRYGQKKPCFVYRLVTDNCLEKKIYDRQINKQGMADRVVDECNPEAHLSIKEVTSLCWDDQEDQAPKDFTDIQDKYIDVVIQKVLQKHSQLLSKEPFHHESLLVDRKDKKLSQAEKRLAKRSYELEKQANSNSSRPLYNHYSNVAGTQAGNQIRNMRQDKPMASVRPMQSELGSQLRDGRQPGRGWIPASVWQRQGMSAQEMTLPLDVVIPTNSPDRASIVLKAGQKVMVLKSPKGIYMQLESGKIIAIRTAFKVGGKDKKQCDKPEPKKDAGVRPRPPLPNLRNSSISIIPRSSMGPGKGKQPMAAARPYVREPPVTVTVTKKRMPEASTSSAAPPPPPPVSRIQGSDSSEIDSDVECAKPEPMEVSGPHCGPQALPGKKTSQEEEPGKERQQPPPPVLPTSMTVPLPVPVAAPAPIPAPVPLAAPPPIISPSTELSVRRIPAQEETSKSEVGTQMEPPPEPPKKRDEPSVARPEPYPPPLPAVSIFPVGKPLDYAYPGRADYYPSYPPYPQYPPPVYGEGYPRANPFSAAAAASRPPPLRPDYTRYSAFHRPDPSVRPPPPAAYPPYTPYNPFLVPPQYLPPEPPAQDPPQ